MKNITKDQLDEILRNLGFNDPYIFIKLMLGVYLQTEINELKAKIKGFEQKYKCSFGDFQARFHEMNQFSVFEKEDDGIDWESYLAFCADYEKIYKTIENAQKDQLNKILRDLDFNYPYLFIKLMLRVYFQSQINELKAKIKGFEQKYECSFGDFQARFHEMSQFSVFEKEDDGIAWKVTNFQLDFAKKQREILN